MSSRNPVRSLVVPEQIVPDDKHLVLFAECDVLIGQAEVVLARLRMDDFPLQYVFRRDRVELRFNECVATRIRARNLRRIDRRADNEVSLVRLFQRCRRRLGRQRQPGRHECH